jgi:tyrosyl-tRNA synthetase
MSISDDLMWRYLELLSFRPATEIAGLRDAVNEGRNPRDVKFELAREIVARFHDPAAAEAAQQEFVARFRRGDLPDDMPEIALSCAGGGVGIARVLSEARLTASNSEAFRMIEQGAVRVDGERIADRELALRPGEYVIQVGKRRFARVVLT